ncbi:aspartyl-tRNA(Asn)/glutamyl-tRNA(Gln) amidotransferase subunit A [Filomicrobium insigne]|uniref:Aspartyl-tRNA(Asn)/glutamyl-tRNA(Gln) amidotransferase subunit A n=1 Tax=Filomicrobium insigne TaxID=418854 RepID=A0A1H0MFL2_9HYPH|nr:amidase [Filomicrobium insigne]SDO79131.1 aspartyl-tRNA(Asn)/glutamyl-tRNA(Gln) amidotransferase subunit A [Filomicrobium insigne]
MAENAGGLNELTVTEAARAIRDGTVTSEKLTEACLARIDERDDAIGAFAHIDHEYALKQATVADQIRGTGNGIGPLHGVPIAVKDIIDVAGYPNENGCPIFSGNRPQRDATCVAALRSAGAIIIGKTVTTELALLTPSTTKNPLNTSHTPGGSSAGSAAAVADLMVPGAVGTQTAGSVLRPASYVGIYGFKPTSGLVSRTGVLQQSHTLDTVGYFGRSIEDLALLTDCMAGYDATDPASYFASGPNVVELAASKPPLTPSFAFVKTPAWDQADPEMREAFTELASELGAQCDEIELNGLARVIEWQRLVQLAENASYYGPLQDRARNLLSDELNVRLDEGVKVPVRAYIEAIASRERAYEAIAEIFEHYSVILTPAAPGPAPHLDEGITGSPIFNGLWTYLGMPAVSVPIMEVNGLPVGVQLVGPRRDDGRLLRTAKWLVEHLAQQPATA